VTNPTRGTIWFRIGPPRRLAGLTVRGRVVRYSVLLPPAGGPARTAMLEATGRALLREAQRGYGRVLRTVLATAGSALPSPVALDQPWLPAAGRALIASRQAGWKQARAQLAAAASGGRTAVWGSTWTTPPVVDPDELEQQARAALDAAVNAFDHLEDTDMAAAAHAQAHAMGELVAGLFGCRAEREGDRWFDVCRLSLMHLRVGQSPGFVARRHCSVCDGDLADCQHQLNTTYAKIADRRPDGSCTICDDTDCVTHVAGTAYSAGPRQSAGLSGSWLVMARRNSGGVAAQRGSDVAVVAGAQDADGEVAQAGDGRRGGGGADWLQRFGASVARCSGPGGRLVWGGEVGGLAGGPPGGGLVT
jgi:hypothetical protein